MNFVSLEVGLILFLLQISIADCIRYFVYYLSVSGAAQHFLIILLVVYGRSNNFKFIFIGF